MVEHSQTKVSPITPDDLAFINEVIKPKNKKGLLYFSLFFLVFSVSAPLIPGRNVHVTSFRSEDYLSGLIFYAAISVVIIAFLYYKSVYCLSRDLKDGNKLSLNLTVLRKAKNRYAQNELVLRRPKSPSFDKILIAKEYLGDWNEGDIVCVEVLVRSGTVLSYEKL